MTVKMMVTSALLSLVSNVCDGSPLSCSRYRGLRLTAFQTRDPLVYCAPGWIPCGHFGVGVAAGSVGQKKHTVMVGAILCKGR